MIMSGGRFDYLQYRFSEIVFEIQMEIINNFPTNNISKETIEEFKKGIECIQKAQIYVQRIDWFLSGDESEDTFHKRLSEDLDKLTE